MEPRVLLWAGLLLLGVDAAATFRWPLSCAQPAHGRSLAGALTQHPRSADASSAAPSARTALTLRGGMQDSEGWGPENVQPEFNLSRLIADRQPSDAGATYRALIMVNYELPRPLLERLWFNTTMRVCADGAINRLYETFDTDEERARFIPEYVRGDLDSVDAKVLGYYQEHGTQIIKDHDQDTTDLEKCILLIQNSSVPSDPSSQSEVVVLGAFGGRLDHEFSHYHVLFKFSRLRLLLLAPGRAAFVLTPGRHVINTAALGRSCGLIPLAGPAERVWTEGLEWDLDGSARGQAALTFGHFISTSNRIRPHAQEVRVNTSAALLWVSDFTFAYDPERLRLF